MTYLAPYVDETGLHYSSYEDIKEFYIEGAKRIFGEDIYVDNDSLDGQLISLFAKGQYDTMKSIEFAFNNYSPQTSYGVVLSRLVLLSGVRRKKSGYSTAYCKLQGDPYTIIRGGVVSDIAGNKWDLPLVVNLGENGTVYVTVTAQKEGDITALANTITQIETPKFGWRSVTNEYPANPASKVESDTELRNRQKRSVALPSQGLTEGTQSALLEVEGVTDCIVKENDEGVDKTIKGVSLPAHSLTCIVKGGSETDIANTIFYHKNQGCYTNGTISITQYDMYNNANVIRFSRPIDVSIKVEVTVEPIESYSSDTTEEIKNKLVDYIESLNISKDVTVGALYSVVNSTIPDLKEPTFSVSSIRIAKLSDSFDTENVIIKLNEEASLIKENITVVVES